GATALVQGVLRADLLAVIRGDPASAPPATGLLVCGTEEGEGVSQRHPGTAEQDQRHRFRRDGPLHVCRTTAVEPAILDESPERRLRPGSLVSYRHHVAMRHQQ